MPHRARPGRRPAWFATLLALFAIVAALGLRAEVARAQPAPATAEATSHPAAPVTEGAHAAAPAGSADAPKVALGAPVRLHDNKVFVVEVGRAGQSPQQRAAAASHVLERALEEPEPPEVHVEEEGDAIAIVFVGKSPVIQFGPEDALASSDASVAVHAAAVAVKVQEAVKAERKRSAIATTVFSFSLVVFSALVAFLLLRKLGELADRTRAWMEQHPDRLPVLRVRGIEVVAASAVRGGLEVSLSGARLIAQIGVAYAWVLIALSLFESTRHYTERLTGFVLTPLSALMGRVASALPVLIIALITVLVVAVALRFVRLFFGSVSRGETHLGWMPRDLAAPTSFLVRFGMIIVTLVIAAPLITGSDDGALSRAGVVSLVALGLAATPILASAAAGIAVVFGRRIAVGDYAVIAGRAGRVRATTMLEVLLEDEDGCDVHIPHLLSLTQPMRVMGSAPPVIAEIVVSSTAGLARTLELLGEASGRIGRSPRVEVLSLDADGARVRIAILTNTTDAKNKLLCTLAETLKEHGIALGRSPAGAETS